MLSLGSGTLLILAAVNVATFLTFGLDKWLAISGLRRVSEANLLLLAFLGGSPGALAGRQLFRHKTKKEPFSTYLLVICMVQAGVLLGLAVA